MFFTTDTYINVKESFSFFRARVENGIARHTDGVVWTLIDNSKLANQIARLAAIVLKYLTQHFLPHQPVSK